MPKYRKFYTKTVESLDINDMPDDFTRLLWVMLPLGLCAEGRGVDNPSWVKAKIFPLRLDVTFEMIEDALTWFSERGMICRYTVDERCYFCIPTWHRYQGNTERESETNYPPPPDEPVPHSRQTPDKLPTDSRSDSQGDAQVDSQGEAPAQELREMPAPAAVVVFYEVTKRKVPNKHWGDQIAQTVGTEPAVLDRWRATINGWLGAGYSKTNVAGMLDWFREERTERGRDNGTGKQRATKGEPPPVIDGWTDFEEPAAPIPKHADAG